MFYSRTVLPSGIRVLTERMPEVRSVSIGFWIGLGSRDEPDEIQGASHFLEHVLFKGTETRTARDIAEAFDSVGGDANAEASKEYTVFYSRVLDKDLPMATDILTDILTNAALRPDEVDSERKVVLEEIAAHEDFPEDLVHDLFARTLFGTHPLGREVMGTVETVNAITPEALRDFYRENYRAPKIVVAAAGNVEHDDLVSRIRSAFTGGGQAAPNEDPTDPPAGKSLYVLHRDTEQAHIVLGGLGYSRRHPDRFAWGVLDDLLGGGSSSRLFQEVREQRGLAYTVYSYRNQYKEIGSYGIYAGVAPGNAQKVLQVIAEVLDRLLDDGITEKELERAKGRFRGGLALGLEDPASRMGRLGRSELIHGEILSVDELIARVDAVTIPDVARVASELLRPEARRLTVIGPFTGEDFREWEAPD